VPQNDTNKTKERGTRSPQKRVMCGTYSVPVNLNNMLIMSIQMKVILETLLATDRIHLQSVSVICSNISFIEGCS
jgi:hypothetical protein